MSSAFPISVLLVEGDPVLARRCAALLALEGFSVTRATTVVDAAAALRESLPDVIVADVDLPAARFSALLATLVENPAVWTVPVVVTGGHKLAALGKNSLSAGGLAGVPASEPLARSVVALALTFAEEKTAAM